MIWHMLLAVAAGLAVLWLAVIAALWAANGRLGSTLPREALRMLPDLVRLLKRLAGDPGLPRGVRVRLWLLLAYLLIPIDLVPDFVPIIGYADDVIVVALALRSVIRHVGPQVIQAHWPGTEDGLAAVLRIAGVTRPYATEPPGAKSPRRRSR
ncbi:YkvA family protein [Actinoallomurus sp. CA-142502]|uniref:YkvA family protein n=1 Tax=Actinoallomurus sp. CA-142502 TaxID=3239885 RepID=UPI003D8D5AF2